MKSEHWDNFLNPEKLKSNLITASIYISAFEVLKDTILHYPREFFSEGFNSKGMKLGKGYEENVLSLKKHDLYASLEWFKNMEAITQKDIETFNEIKGMRNKFAHEMAESIYKGINQDEFSELFAKLFLLFEKIDLWWIKNYELALNTDIDLEDADLESAFSSNMLMLRVMMDIVSADEGDSWKYYNHIFNKENDE